MAKKTNTVGGHVVLELRHPGDLGDIVISGTPRSETELVADLETLRYAARRRLDKFEDEFGSARIVYETEAVCEYCGWSWTEDDPNYNGGCCDADQEACEAAPTEMENGT